MPDEQDQIPANDVGYRRHRCNAIPAKCTAACHPIMCRVSRTVHHRCRGVVGHVHVCGHFELTRGRGVARLDAPVPVVGGLETLDSGNSLLSRELLQMRFNVTAQVSTAKCFEKSYAALEVSCAQ